MVWNTVLVTQCFWFVNEGINDETKQILSLSCLWQTLHLLILPLARQLSARQIPPSEEQKLLSTSLSPDLQPAPVDGQETITQA